MRPRPGRSWRCGGCRREAAARSAPPRPARRLRRAPQQRHRCRPGPGSPPGSSITSTNCWLRVGPTPTAAARATPSARSTTRSSGTEVTGPPAVSMTCTARPSTQRRPVGVEVADVARAVPVARGTRPGGAFGRPEPEVAGRGPRRADRGSLRSFRCRAPVGRRRGRSPARRCAPRLRRQGGRRRPRRGDRRVRLARSLRGRCRRPAGPRSCRTACAAWRSARAAATARSVSDGTGAPAEKTMRSPARPR